MDEVIAGMAETARGEEEGLSRAELQIEHEKLKLERERILLERERLENTRARVRNESSMLGPDGRTAFSLSTVALVSIICLLVGGMLGALTSTVRRDYRLQKVMRTLAESTPGEEGLAAADGDTNVTAQAGSGLPPWLRTMKPKSAYSEISLVVIH